MKIKLIYNILFIVGDSKMARKFSENLEIKLDNHQNSIKNKEQIIDIIVLILNIFFLKILIKPIFLSNFVLINNFFSII